MIGVGPFLDGKQKIHPIYLDVTRVAFCDGRACRDGLRPPPVPLCAIASDTIAGNRAKGNPIVPIQRFMAASLEG